MRSDSLTGDVAEYIVRKTFGLMLTGRNTKGVDALGPGDVRWQVKSAVKDRTSLAVDGEALVGVDRLAVVFFNDDYTPHHLLTFRCSDLPREEFRISQAFLASTPHEVRGPESVALDAQDRIDLSHLGGLFVELEAAGVIRSRHIVGDIGETLACEHLGLRLCENRGNVGFDACDDRHQYEIKTRRVYESARRKGPTRRLNNIVGKSAHFLVVVTLDKAFRCSGMWRMPMQNLRNPAQATLTVVRDTPGVEVLVPTSIEWLR